MIQDDDPRAVRWFWLSLVGVTFAAALPFLVSVIR